MLFHVPIVALVYFKETPLELPPLVARPLVRGGEFLNPPPPTRIFKPNRFKRCLSTRHKEDVKKIKGLNVVTGKK